MYSRANGGPDSDTCSAKYALVAVAVAPGEDWRRFHPRYEHAQVLNGLLRAIYREGPNTKAKLSTRRPF